jgi:CubicO group peptidase (beta-lactamase class C family)
LPQGAYLDWELMTSRLAAEAPFWEPGTRHGYHGSTFGWLVGEVVRRVSGKSLGTFFQDEIARPLGIDFWIGLPETIEPRVAPIIRPEPPRPGEPQPRVFAATADPNSLQHLWATNNGGFTPASRAARAAELPASNGITNARGLAGMYAPLACGGSLNGVQFVDGDSLARMAAVSSASDEDAILLAPTRFSLGFHKAMDRRRLPPGQQGSLIIAEEAFGHVGAGGSLGFADPRARLAFGFAMNRMGAGAMLSDRCQCLVDAAYRSLGYTSSASGAWR